MNKADPTPFRSLLRDPGGSFFLGEEGEKVYEQLLRNLRLEEDFSLEIIEVIGEDVPKEIIRRLRTLYEVLETPLLTQDSLEDVLLELLSHCNRSQSQESIVVVYGRNDDAWLSLLMRLNERRNHLARLSRPLLVVGSTKLNDLLRDHSPDLWSIRSAVHSFPVRIVPQDETFPSPQNLTFSEGSELDVEELSSIIEQLEARQKSEREREARYRLRLSKALLSQRKGGLALLQAEKALMLSKLTGNHYLEAGSLVHQGRAFHILFNLEKALESLHKGFEIFEQLGERRERAIALGEIARLKARRGEVDEALNHHLEELKVYEQLGEEREIAITLGCIAQLKVRRGEVDEALDLHQKELEIFEQLGEAREIALALGDIAQIKASWGEVDEALALHQKELEIFEQLGTLDGQARAWWGLAKISLRNADTQKAIEQLNKSYELSRSASRLDGISTLGLELGKLLHERGQTKQAIPILERSLEGFRTLQWPIQAEQARALLEQFTLQDEEISKEST